MTSKTPSDEFVFLRDKIEKIGRLLIKGSSGDLIEASFMLGCLHSICDEDAIKFIGYGEGFKYVSK